jgi:hypothetical protein
LRDEDLKLRRRDFPALLIGADAKALPVFLGAAEGVIGPGRPGGPTIGGRELDRIEEREAAVSIAEILSVIPVAEADV